MKSKVLRVKTSSENLAKLKFILEGYDHLASITVISAPQGLAELFFHPLNEEDVLEVIKNLPFLVKILN